MSDDTHASDQSDTPDGPDTTTDQDAEPSLNAPAPGRPDGVEDDEASPSPDGDPQTGGMARRPPADS